MVLWVYLQVDNHIHLLRTLVYLITMTTEYNNICLSLANNHLCILFSAGLPQTINSCGPVKQNTEQYIHIPVDIVAGSHRDALWLHTDSQ